MGEMVERVAVVIASALEHAYQEREEPTFDDHVKAARAAIEAMREPTEAMVASIYGPLRLSAGEHWMNEAEAEAAWRSMIDAALRD